MVAFVCAFVFGAVSCMHTTRVIFLHCINYHSSYVYLYLSIYVCVLASTCYKLDAGKSMCKVNSVYPLIFRILDSCFEMLLLNRCLSWSCYIKMNSIDLLSACCFFEVTFFFFLCTNVCHDFWRLLCTLF